MCGRCVSYAGLIKTSCFIGSPSQGGKPSFSPFIATMPGAEGRLRDQETRVRVPPSRPWVGWRDKAGALGWVAGGALVLTCGVGGRDLFVAEQITDIAFEVVTEGCEDGTGI